MTNCTSICTARGSLLSTHRFQGHRWATLTEQQGRLVSPDETIGMLCLDFHQGPASNDKCILGETLESDMTHRR